jgi:hypothetical protein
MLRLYLNNTTPYDITDFIDLDAWNNIVLYWDKTEAKLYKNGIFFENVTSYIGSETDEPTYPIVLGAMQDAYGTGFEDYIAGKFDEFRLYEADELSFTDEDIYDFYNLGRSKLTVDSLTLTAPGSLFYSPVAGEPSGGTYRFTGRAIPGQWDIAGRTDVYTNPYIWDLSALIPSQSSSVKLLVGLYTEGSAQIDFEQVFIWRDELGAVGGTHVPHMLGANFVLPACPATSGSTIKMSTAEFTVQLGPTRKLRVGRDRGYAAIYIMYKGYDI